MIKGCIASFATHPFSLFLKLLLMILQGIELVVAAMLQKQLLVRYSKSDYEHEDFCVWHQRERQSLSLGSQRNLLYLYLKRTQLYDLIHS